VVSTNVTPLGATVQAPPIVQELEALFANLDDAPLLRALAGPVRPGPKTHSVSTLWRCLLTKHHMGIASTDALIRTLTNNPWVAQVCGIPWPNGIPHKSTFSRFFAKLSHPRYSAKVKEVSRDLVRRRYQETPGFGRLVAVDSTTIKAWSNGGKPVKSDPEAGWSIKKGSQGVKEMVYGWKLHLLVDCGPGEMPIAANISAGNVHDSQRISNVLSEARKTYPRFLPRFVIADAGYSSKEIFHLIRSQFKSQPAIKLNPQHKTLLRGEGPKQATAEFQALGRQRQSVERAFSLLKRNWALNNITTQGIRKVTTHCYLALIVMQTAYHSRDTLLISSSI